jgi:hypothetical protein
MSGLRVLLNAPLARELAKRGELPRQKPKPSPPQRRRLPGANFDYPAGRIPTAGPISVWLADDLVGKADALASAVATRAQSAAVECARWFAVEAPPAANLLIAPLSDASDGTGGAYHAACDATDLYCDACITDTGERTTALFVAEYVEVLSAIQGQGWDCGNTNGEALSRALAELAFPGALDDYSSFAVWLDTPDRPDWISEQQGSDTDFIAIGCGVGFLTWLLSQGHSVNDLVAASGPTLAATYASLGHTGSAYDDYRAACDERWPVGQASGVTTDNPWDEPSPPPPPPPPGGPTLSLSADLAAGSYVLVSSDALSQLAKCVDELKRALPSK